jgi:hypothetical protein
MRPINITTAMPGLMVDHSEAVFNYFTHKTHIHTTHWGTKDTHGVYYPTSTTLEFFHGATHTNVHRVFPKDENVEGMKHLGYHVHGKPHCHDLDSCHDLCQHKYEDGSGVPAWLWWLGALLGACVIGFLFCCCFVMLSRRRKRRQGQPERRKSSLNEKLGRKPTEKTQNVDTDPAGHPADPATTTTAAGPAAGAEAARAQGEGNNAPAPGDDGRGTTGRRAEEGRGRVNFADGEKPGDEGKDKPPDEPMEKPSGEPAEKPSTEVKDKPAGEPSSPPAATAHAEPQPVPDKDGAGGVGTGHHLPDVGSMRGRKRNRPEGIAGLGF